MDIGVKDTILAIITIDKSKVSGGSVPTFYAKDMEEQKKNSIQHIKDYNRNDT